MQARWWHTLRTTYGNKSNQLSCLCMNMALPHPPAATPNPRGEKFSLSFGSSTDWGSPSNSMHHENRHNQKDNNFAPRRVGFSSPPTLDCEWMGCLDRQIAQPLHRQLGVWKRRAKGAGTNRRSKQAESRRRPDLQGGRAAKCTPPRHVGAHPPSSPKS